MESGTTTSIALYVANGSKAHKLFLGVYDTTSSGLPGHLLASGSLKSPKPGAWNAVSVGAASIAQGSTYWIALLGTGGSLNFRDSANGSASYVGANGGLSSLPSTYAAGAEYNVSPVSAYVAGTVASPSNMAAPTVSGTAVQGGMLTASSGTWSGTTPMSYAYQWQDCSNSACANISGATSSSYVLQAADVGDSTDVVVTATNAAGSASANSAQTAVIAAQPPAPPSNTGVPTISGTTTVGQTLATTNGNWSGSPTSYSYAWQDCDSSGANCATITGATASSYVLGPSDVGHTIRSLVTAGNAGGTGSAVSSQTGVVAAQPSVAAFSFSPSSPMTGQVVAFDGSGSSCGAAPCSYSWADDPPSGGSWPLGTGQMITFTFTGAGTKYVTLTVTDALGRTATVEHDVVVALGPPTNTALPGISGSLQQGQTLSASAGSWTGSPTSYGYKWQDCDSSGGSCVAISGAGSSTYTLVSADVGHTLRVVVTASNSAGSGSATSAQTGLVAALSSPPANTAPPTISGTPQQGQTLSASTGSWTGSPTGYGYQWQDCASAGCTNIVGATASSYVVQASDLGDAVDVVVTASNAAGSTSATSARTAAVTAPSGGGSQTLNCYPTPLACGYPDPAAAMGSASHVGSGQSCSSLPQVNGNLSTSSNGQSIQNETINGQLTIRNTGVTVNNVCVLVNGGGQANSGTAAIVDNESNGSVLIENSTIGGANATSGGSEEAIRSFDSSLTLSHDYVLNCGECLWGGDFTVNDSYVLVNATLPNNGGGEHYEDVYLNQDNGGATFTANHDTLLNQFDQTSVLFGDVQNGGSYKSGPCGNHWTVKNSLLAGGGQMITTCAAQTSAGTSTMDIENNHFARCLTTPLTETSGGNWLCTGTGYDGSDSHGYYPYGGSYSWDYETYCPPTAGQTWTANTWDDNGSTVGC
jgi:hypothetical protein